MVEPSPLVGITLNIVAWLGWSLAVGYLGHRRPLDSFVVDRWWSRLRSFERGGTWYARRLRIKDWKDRLPELGAFFDGGFAKRMVCRDRDYLELFVIETRRAEWVHWIAPALWPVFAIWNPPWAVAVMALYAIVVNLPCLIVQRHNRARLLKALERFQGRDVTIHTFVG